MAKVRPGPDHHPRGLEHIATAAAAEQSSQSSTNDHHVFYDFLFHSITLLVLVLFGFLRDIIVNLCQKSSLPNNV